MEFGFFSILPIIVCFALIIGTKRPFLSIIIGLLVSSLVILFRSGEWFAATKAFATVLTDLNILKILLFIPITGAIVYGMQRSGGIEGLILFLNKRNSRIKNPVITQLFVMTIGFLMFVDATSSMAVTSIVGKPLFAQAEIPKEKLALIVNSTASPIAWLIPFGGASAITVGALSINPELEEAAFSYVLKAVPFQFYTLSLLILLFISIVFRFEIGPIKKIPFSPSDLGVAIEKNAKAKAINMLLPSAILIIGIFSVLLITGEGELFKGNGSSAVFFSGLISLVAMLLIYTIRDKHKFSTVCKWYFLGIKKMLSITCLLTVALVLGTLIGKLDTASYLLQVTNFIPPQIFVAVILILSTLIAFTSGTSSGTVAIVTPLILPLIADTEISIPLVIGAVISGSVFGDQNSVISDSVIMTSSLTGVNSITHVKTQMPYTLIALALSIMLYLILGFIL